MTSRSWSLQAGLHFSQRAQHVVHGEQAARCCACCLAYAADNGTSYEEASVRRPSIPPLGPHMQRFTPRTPLRHTHTPHRGVSRETTAESLSLHYGLRCQ